MAIAIASLFLYFVCLKPLTFHFNCRFVMSPPSLFEVPGWFSARASTRALLVAAIQTWDDTTISEQYIQQALSQPNVEIEVLLSAYRYYFYKNNNAMALDVALRVCDRIQQTEQWSTCWEQLKPILLERIEESVVRLYLSAYAASGLLFARLGQIAAAQAIAEQVQQLEAKEFGAEVLLTVLNPPPEEED